MLSAQWLQNFHADRTGPAPECGSSSRSGLRFFCSHPIVCGPMISCARRTTSRKFSTLYLSLHNPGSVKAQGDISKSSVPHVVILTPMHVFHSMDIFEDYLTPAALPVTPGPVQETSPNGQSSEDPFVSHEVTFEKPGVREKTRQQWETLKPLIKQIYIDENKTFRHLARKLRDEHNFEPTYLSFPTRDNLFRDVILIRNRKREFSSSNQEMGVQEECSEG